MDIVVDAPIELDLLDERDELAGEGVGVAEDVRGRSAGAEIFECVEVPGINKEEREAEERGLAEAVRGGKIVE